ncbi:MAG TPA: DNA polymerase III subunit gamma/tau, partial [Nocardioides sp.]
VEQSAAPEPAAAPQQAPQQAPKQAPAAGSAPAAPAGGLGMVDIRRLWPDVLEKLRQHRKPTWALVSQSAQVLSLSGQVVTLGFPSPGLRDTFANGNHAAPLRQAVIDVIGTEWTFEAVVDPGSGGTPAAPPAPNRPAEPAQNPAQTQAQTPAPPASSPAAQSPAPEPPAYDQAPPDDPPPWDDAPINAAREAIQPTRAGGPAGTDRTEALAAADAAAHPDDADAESAELGGAALLERELGATMIEEIPHS